jgi:methylmalonyl-CoA mutase N-terminal domain/subunit
VLAHEAGVALTADPLGGSYYVESLCEELEARVEALLAEVDAAGGTLAAIEGGYQVDAIAQAAYEAQCAQEAGDRIVVGVNAFTDGSEEQRPTAQVIDPELEARQRERTRQVRERRDARAAESALADLQAAASGTENVLPRMRACVEADVTLGEIATALRRVWGEYRGAGHV